MFHPCSLWLLYLLPLLSMLGRHMILYLCILVMIIAALEDLQGCRQGIRYHLYRLLYRMIWESLWS